MKYYIGKVKADTFGHKADTRYLWETIHKSNSICEHLTRLLSGFAGYEIVQVEIKEVKRKKKEKK